MADENDIDARMAALLKDHQAMGARPGGSSKPKAADYPLEPTQTQEKPKRTAKKK